MSLAGILSIASSGLSDINARIGVVSNNVANASTPGYTTETTTPTDLIGGAFGYGVLTGPVTRTIDQSLRQALQTQNTAVSGLSTATALLQPVDTALGAPGQGNDLGSLLAGVQNAFSTLLAAPSNASQQQAVVVAAGNLTATINQLGDSYARQRQAAQTDIVSSIAQANGDLSQIGSLNAGIAAARASGGSTADLENQRDAAVNDLGAIMGIKTFLQPNGALTITTASGSILPTDGGTPLSTADATVSPASTHANGGIPPILLNGADLTDQLTGGRLGADIEARDKTLPAFQGELDEFSYQLATRFGAQGLTLFTDPKGNVPAGGGAPTQSGYIGFSSTIQVNPTILATPSLVRDGNVAIAGSPSGAAAFTPNPPSGPAGFTGLINNILTFALGADAQPNVPQPPPATSGLGPDGTLSAPYAAPRTLADNAADLTAAQSAVIATASSDLAQAQTSQTSLNNAFTTSSGVNIDAQMSLMLQLQNSYEANARVVSSVRSLFTALDDMVQ